MITKNIADKHKRVVPLPKKAVFNGDFIKLNDNWYIELDKESGKVCKTDGIQQRCSSITNIAEKWSRKFGMAGVSHGGETGLNGSCIGKISLHTDNNMNSEGYKINIGPEQVNISAGSEKGIDYAMQTLWQLSPDGNIPAGNIEDKPSIKIRGFHINFDSFRQMDIEEALRSIETAAELKLNTILLEYADRFPYEKHSRIAVNTTLKKEDIKRINDKAKELGIELIPLQQTIGHLEYILEHDYYKSIRENRETISQICPLNPDSFELIKELLEEMIEAHPGIRYIHIGGDEARSLGKCPSCKEKVEKYGISRLYIDHINSICDFITSKGITPIIWDDVLCAHPEALDLLDKRIVIMYWDYWTVSKSSPYFIARYDRKGRPVTVCDAGWDNEWKHELTDLERSIMSTFASKVPLKESLSKKFIELYGPYLGNEFPKRIKGYPYLEFFQDKGFKVIGAPTSLGNGDDYNTLPNYWRFIPNIRTAAERCIEANAEGLVTTAWYNYHPVMFHMGLGATAQFSWGVEKEL
ncbi:MAG TPA: family 20 glycosylhydrolase [Clostridiales bacterium]|nr:family 20 glycosylhydrolase [Clostridiales bacterium]